MRVRFNPLTLSLLFLVHCSAPPQSFDVLIQNGWVYDGQNSPPQQQDIGIQGGQIVAIGNLTNATATRIIEANGLAVAPGFIDMHAHLDPIMRMPDAESHVKQGVTTALGGPDGGGPWPFGAYLDSLEKMPLGMNVAYLTGHNRIRSNIMQLSRRSPTEAELSQMKVQVQTAMNEGAFGISTGLKYLPGAFSKVEEVIELSKVAAQSGGIYTSHLREEGLGLIGGVTEAIQIARDAEIPVILTHHKVVGKPMWGSSSRTLYLVDSAREVGLDVKIDQYPYTASHTSISILIPAWARAGGQQAFKARMQKPTTRDSIFQETLFNIINDRGGSDLKRVQFSRVSWKPDLEGKTLYDWALEEQLEPTLENGADLVLQAQLNGGASCVFHAMDEKDVQAIMKHPQTMVASDGRLSQPGQGHPHPRAYGTFPRVLGHYAREEAIFPLETAIYKMTGLPAQSLGLTDRGMLKEGNHADIVIFDPAQVKDQSTFEAPHQYPAGISMVLVNGALVVDNGKMTEQRTGTVLRGPAWKFKP